MKSIILTGLGLGVFGLTVALFTYDTLMMFEEAHLEAVGVGTAEAINAVQNSLENTIYTTPNNAVTPIIIEGLNNNQNLQVAVQQMVNENAAELVNQIDIGHQRALDQARSTSIRRPSINKNAAELINQFDSGYQRALEQARSNSIRLKTSLNEKRFTAFYLQFTIMAKSINNPDFKLWAFSIQQALFDVLNEMNASDWFRTMFLNHSEADLSEEICRQVIHKLTNNRGPALRQAGFTAEQVAQIVNLMSNYITTDYDFYFRYIWLNNEFTT